MSKAHRTPSAPFSERCRAGLDVLLAVTIGVTGAACLVLWWTCSRC